MFVRESVNEYGALLLGIPRSSSPNRYPLPGNSVLYRVLCQPIKAGTDPLLTADVRLIAQHLELQISPSPLCWQVRKDPVPMGMSPGFRLVSS